MKTIGQRLKYYREWLKETQDRFAARMNVSKTTLISYEFDKTDPGLKGLQNLYNSLQESDISMDSKWLITGEGKPFVETEDRELEIELQLRKRIDELQNELLNGFRNNKKD